jgi:serine/threonine protein kinase
VLTAVGSVCQSGEDCATELIHPISEAGGSDSDAPTLPMSAEAASELARPGLHGYEILEELARGGMGVVYRARQKGLNRIVALKMILSGAHAGPGEIARFRIEAEAVARLQHPHIVQIHQVGEVRGLPFFSLEFIDGGSLDDKLAGVPQQPRAAAELVAILAEAMQHAHEHGIIHRDLKPANVLLSSVGAGSEFSTPHKETPGPGYGIRTTEYGLPKISDFGLAKPVSGESGLTRTGVIVGTPSYMAPEQANNGRIGPAADIYALGAILYEMLTGRPPFRAALAVETIRQVIDEEPVAPSRLQPKLPVDLETICLKCLEKDAGKRYPSALALAEDLHHFLADEPIRARPISRVRRLVKWTRRRPALAGLVSVSSVALVVLAGVIAVSAVSLKQQRDFAFAQRDLAATAKEDADRQRQRAERNFERARAAVDQMLTRVGDQKLKNVPLMEQLQRDLLEDALEFNQQFLEERATDPSVRKETVHAYLRAANIRSMLGHHDQAVAAYREAIQLLQQVVDETPEEVASLRTLALSYEGLGSQLAEMNNVTEAETAYRKALGVFEDLIGRYPGMPTYREELAGIHNRMGNLFSSVFRWEEEEKSYRQALAIREALVADFPKVAEYRHGLAETLDFLGIQLAPRQRQDEAEKMFQRAIDTITALLAEFPKEVVYRKDLAQFRFNLATLCSERGRLKEAEVSFGKTIELQTALVHDFPQVPAYRQSLAKQYFNLGLVHQQSKSYPEALDAYRQAAGLDQALVAEFPKVPAYREKLAGTLNNMCVALWALGQKAEAEKICRQAIGYMEPLAAEFPNTNNYISQLGLQLGCLASFLHARNALPEARQLLERAIPLQQTGLKLRQGREIFPGRLRANMTDLAIILLKQKDHTAAAAAAADLPRTFPKNPGDEYKAGCILALCVPLAGKDEHLDDAKRRELERSYADQAMAALRAAQQHGFKDVGLLKKDTNLDSLRSRADFRELLTLLEKTKP